MIHKADFMPMLGFAIMTLVCGCVPHAWEVAKSEDTIDAYQEFLKQPHKVQLSEKAWWRIAELKDSVEGYEEYLQNASVHSSTGKVLYEGKFALEAKKRLYEKTRALGTVAAFDDFLKKYPQSEFASAAHQRLERLLYDQTKMTDPLRARTACWEFLERYPMSEFAPEVDRERTQLEREFWKYSKTQTLGTVVAFEDFLEKNPQGRFTGRAESDLQILKVELSPLEEAARRALPQGMRFSVAKPSQDRDEPEFMIAAPLLEEVRGNYGTHEKLTRLVQLRCAKLIKSIAEEGLLSDPSVLVIQAWHDIFQSHLHRYTGQPKVAMTLYEVAIPARVLNEENLKSASYVTIMGLWEVRENIIPDLSFGDVELRLSR